jgi:hypothetical protein
MFLRRLLAALLFCATASAAAAQSLYPSPTFNATTTQSLTVGGTPQSFPPSGQIAGTSDTQTLSNKTLASPTVTGSTPLAYLSAATDQAESFLVQSSLHAYEWAFGVIEMPSIAALRANTIPWPTVHVQGWNGAGTPGGGDLEYVSTDTTSADNSCTIFNDNAGTPHRYYRVTRVAGSIPVTDCGAIGNGSTNDNTAFANAASYVGSGGVLLLPPGLNFKITSLTATVSVVSAGTGATITAASDLGAGNALLDLNGRRVENLSLIGPNGTGYPGVGVAPAQMYALEDYSSPSSCSGGSQFPTFRNLKIEGFYAGIVLNCWYGHQHIEDNLITDNYYGLYVIRSGQDIRSRGNDYTGNTMASVACASTSVSDCLTSSEFIGDHNGFAPFCFYQEPGISTPTGFLALVTMIDARCEAVGNAYIRSEAHSNGNIDSLTMTNTGFSWDLSGQCGGSYCELQNTYPNVSTTGTTSNGSYIVGSVVTTTGMMAGMRITDGDSDFPYGTFLVSATVGFSCNGTALTSGQICANEPATAGHSGDSLTVGWDGSFGSLPIDAGHSTISGVIHIEEGIAPVPPGTSNYIIYGGSYGTGATVLLDYRDGNNGPPGTSTDLVGTNDGYLQYAAFTRVAGQHSPFQITINSGSSSGTDSFPWQDVLAAKELISGYNAGILCSPTASAGAPIVSASAAISGANLVATLTLGGNATATTVFNCIVASSWN